MVGCLGRSLKDAKAIRSLSLGVSAGCGAPTSKTTRTAVTTYGSRINLDLSTGCLSAMSVHRSRPNVPLRVHLVLGGIALLVPAAGGLVRTPENRSEERRVGKECSSRRGQEQGKK